MKKNLKTLSLTLTFIAIFATMIFVGGENKVFAEPNQAVQTVNESTKVAPEAKPLQSIPQKNAYELTHMEKKGFKYGIFKFFTAIFGVIISALAIFFGLKFYKKFILKNNLDIDNVNFDKTLESPKDFKEAINLFLDKTDKE